MKMTKLISVDNLSTSQYGYKQAVDTLRNGEVVAFPTETVYGLGDTVTFFMNRDEVDILNIKCDPILIGSLRGRPGFRTAYHMNKDKWITILLDGSAAQEDIIPLLTMSYDLTKKKIRKRGKQHEQF